MLLIKILSGPQTGQVIPIKEGIMTIGRSSQCDLTLLSNGVSKTHAQVAFNGHQLLVKDLGSRNGTIVNGVQVRKVELNVGDKIAFHDVYVEIINENNMHSVKQYVHPSTQHSATLPPAQGYSHPTQVPQPHYPQHPAMPQHPQAAYQMHSGMQGQQMPHSQVESQDFDEEMDEEAAPEDLFERINEYLEDVVLPGAYKLPQMLEFKWVLGIFIGAFIILVTSLSTIPLLRILRDSVQRESQEHALTIAKTLAEVNAAPISQGLKTAVSVEIALKRPGVDEAYVISDIDGEIIAPASKAGNFPNIPFVHEGRKLGKESVSQVDSETVIAMVPLEFYNPDTGQRAITAYSVVVYNMAALAVDDGKTLSLFIQTLFIAILIGAILFFFLYNMILHPIVSLNQQLNDALKNDSSQIDVDYEFDALKELGSNISSALSRNQAGGSGNDSDLNFEADRFLEMQNLVELVGFGAFTVSASDQTVTAANAAFEDATRLAAHDFVSQTVAGITDQALKLSLEDLIERASGQPDQIHTNDLEFSGEPYQLAVHTIQGTSGIAYYLFVVFPGGQEEAVE